MSMRIATPRLFLGGVRRAWILLFLFLDSAICDEGSTSCYCTLLCDVYIVTYCIARGVATPHGHCLGVLMADFKRTYLSRQRLCWSWRSLLDS